MILAYLNDITCRSKKHLHHLEYFFTIFLRCHKYNIHLDPLKCVFCATSWLLGFIVSKSTITVDLLKFQSINKLPPPHNLHQLQSLQGKANFLCSLFPIMLPLPMVFFGYYDWIYPLHWMTRPNNYSTH